MLIDWFTVAAQVVNFLVLVWLLRRFLYGPVTRAMAEREERVAERLAAGDRMKAEALAEAESYRRQAAELEATREARMREAKEEVERWRHERIEEARSEVGALERRWRETLRKEQEVFLEELKVRATHEVFELARRVIEELSSAELEVQILRRFLERLAEVGESERARLVASARDDGGFLVIRSAYPLSGEQRAELSRTVGTLVAADMPVRFEAAPELVGGIELRAGGYALSWTVTEHLASLESRLRDLLREAHARGEEERDGA